MSIETNLIQMERAREEYWQRNKRTSPIKLRWRAMTVRHCFHVLPGQTILELGAGSGMWTEQLSAVLRHQNEITAVVFNSDFAQHARWRTLQNVRCLEVKTLEELPAESFDYVVGTAILCHNEYHRNLSALYRVLKPGGQLLFFESNFWNPQVFLKNAIGPLGRWTGNAPCQVGLRRYQLVQIASQVGFTQLEVIPYDIIHPRIPTRLVHLVQSVAFIVEHAPGVKELCGTLYIRARRPGASDHPATVDLAEYPQFRGAVSFVVPCHNEESNVAKLVNTLGAFYGPYIHEIVIVDDNSTDRTAEVAAEIARLDTRVKLVRRQPPNGVGRALRDGYAAATGTYILTMDGDFVQIVPEFRDLFDAAAQGFDGAIGSRFTQESVMVNYPFLKILCNRSFHLLANLLLPIRVHDISNNLKLFRSEILKRMQIDEPHFAANAEIGLRAILAGYRIKEVPISWINRTMDMGSSSFRIAGVASDYFRALRRIVFSTKRGGKQADPVLERGERIQAERTTDRE